MSLAQLSSDLGQKDSEKTGLIEEISKLEQVKFMGFKGMLRVSVYQVDRVKGDLTIDYEVTPENAYIATTESLKNKSVGDVLEFLVQEKGVLVNCTINSAYVPEFVQIDDGPADTADLPDAIQSVYTVRLSGDDIPGDTELRTELPLLLVSTTRKSDGGEESPAENKPVCHVKAAYDDLEVSLKSKQLQLTQLSDEMNQLAAAIKEVRNPPKAAKSSGGGNGKSSTMKGKKGKKKSAAAAAQREEQEGEDAEGSGSSADTMYGTVVKGVVTGVNWTINNRAYVLFGAASMVIYAFGDYASV